MVEKEEWYKKNLQTLGQGSYGIVYKAMNSEQKQFSVKKQKI